MSTIQAIPVFGLVLTGGRSTRMGQDKAALTYSGQTQLARSAALLSQVCQAVFVSARADQHDALRGQWPVIVDVKQDLGPLAGIASAQHAHPDVAWLIIACDMPRLDLRTLEQLVQACTSQHDAIAFSVGKQNHIEPLCALWLPGSGRHVSNAIARRQTSPQRLLNEMHTLIIKPDNEAALGNVNTQAEYLVAAS